MQCVTLLDRFNDLLFVLQSFLSGFLFSSRFVEKVYTMRNFDFVRSYRLLFLFIFYVWFLNTLRPVIFNFRNETMKSVNSSKYACGENAGLYAVEVGGVLVKQSCSPKWWLLEWTSPYNMCWIPAQLNWCEYGVANSLLVNEISCDLFPTYGFSFSFSLLMFCFPYNKSRKFTVGMTTNSSFRNFAKSFMSLCYCFRRLELLHCNRCK